MALNMGWMIINLSDPKQRTAVPDGMQHRPRICTGEQPKDQTTAIQDPYGETLTAATTLGSGMKNEERQSEPYEYLKDHL